MRLFSRVGSGSGLGLNTRIRKADPDPKSKKLPYNFFFYINCLHKDSKIILIPSGLNKDSKMILTFLALFIDKFI